MSLLEGGGRILITGRSGSVARLRPRPY